MRKFWKRKPCKVCQMRRYEAAFKRAFLDSLSSPNRETDK